MDITYSSPNRRRVIVALPSKMAEDEFPEGGKNKSSEILMQNIKQWQKWIDKNMILRR